ncbi:hypothetical protein Vadar_031743 [Vaccinium darrowii]|uniref:Uncharacterized protein n=1 Tax=Vaccinium darrowii TaxID=229202 RepID=A0ACB7X5J4_9ERIC|nr:hypothetical protein Vadar_031743 [Vaccinium darrowii]
MASAKSQQAPDWNSPYTDNDFQFFCDGDTGKKFAALSAIESQRAALWNSLNYTHIYSENGFRVFCDEDTRKKLPALSAIESQLAALWNPLNYTNIYSENDFRFFCDEDTRKKFSALSATESRLAAYWDYWNSQYSDNDFRFFCDGDTRKKFTAFSSIASPKSRATHWNSWNSPYPNFWGEDTPKNLTEFYSMASAESQQAYINDVFLSFRGEDTQNYVSRGSQPYGYWDWVFESYPHLSKLVDMNIAIQKMQEQDLLFPNSYPRLPRFRIVPCSAVEVVDRALPEKAKADHPRTPLVDVVLTHTNYGSWSRSIEMALCAKNKLGFIDNTIPCPADPDIQPLWKRVSTMVLSWLLNSISNTITPSLASCRTPYELWRDLESRFTQGNNATIFKIQKEISNLKQNNLDITNYYNTFKTLWDQLDGITPLPACTCTNYSAMMSQRFKPQPSRSNSNNNQRRNSHDQRPYQQNQAKTFNSPQPQHPPYASPLNRQQQSTRQSPVTHPNQPRGDNRGGSYPPRGDVQQEPHNRGSKDPNAYCTHCNQTGHYQSGCFKLIGYPDWFFNRPSRAPSNQSNYAAQSSVMDSNPHLSPTEASQASAFYEHPSAFFSAEPLTYPDPPQPTNPPTSNTTTSSPPPSPAPSPDLPPQPIHPSAHPTNSISSDNNTNSLDPSSSTVPSRPSRVHRPPGYLRDYLCPTLPSATTASTHASPQSSADLMLKAREKQDKSLGAGNDGGESKSSGKKSKRKGVKMGTTPPKSKKGEGSGEKEENVRKREQQLHDVSLVGITIPKMCFGSVLRCAREMLPLQMVF